MRYYPDEPNKFRIKYNLSYDTNWGSNIAISGLIWLVGFLVNFIIGLILILTELVTVTEAQGFTFVLLGPFAYMAAFLGYIIFRILHGKIKGSLKYRREMKAYKSKIIKIDLDADRSESISFIRKLRG